MYANTIKFKHSKVCLFITSNECFTPQNPVFVAVQKTLVEMGYTQEDNHVFTGCMGDLRFSYEEIEMYNPFINGMLEEQIKYNRQHMDSASGFIIDLEYIFTTGVPADKVSMLLNERVYLCSKSNEK